MNSADFKNKLKDLNKKNVAIMGHMGSGKSIIGKILANMLNFEHVDSDKEITKLTNKSINQIFKEKGEEYFRIVEAKILSNLINKNDIILSLGGGSILNPSIRKKLEKNSITLFLDVSLIELEKRLKRSIKRPLLKNTNINKKVKELDTSRRKYYSLADIKIKNVDTPIKTCKNFINKFSDFHEKTNTNNG